MALSWKFAPPPQSQRGLVQPVALSPMIRLPFPWLEMCPTAMWNQWYQHDLAGTESGNRKAKGTSKMWLLWWLTGMW